MLKDLPRVSLLIPTFNRAARLKNAVASCLRQDYPHLEVVISDNCSSDDTHDLVRREFSGDPRVRYFRNDRNLGLGPNWRRALFDYARGDLGGLLCDDEYLINPGHISAAVHLILKHDLKFVQCGVRDFNEIVGQKKDLYLSVPEVVSSQWLLENCGREFRQGPVFFGLMGIFDLQLARHLDAFNPPVYGLDFELAWRLIIASPGIGYLPGAHRLLRSHNTMDCLTSSYTKAFHGSLLFHRLYNLGREYGYSPQTMQQFKTGGSTYFARHFLLPLWIRDHGNSLSSLRRFLQNVALIDEGAARRVFRNPFLALKALLLTRGRVYHFLSDIYCHLRFHGSSGNG